MTGQFDINTSLNVFRSVVEEKIRKGAFDSHGSQGELLERSSYVYSDLRARLLQKMKNSRSGMAANKNKFTLIDLEQVTETQGSHIQSVLHRAYVQVARASK